MSIDTSSRPARDARFAGAIRLAAWTGTVTLWVLIFALLFTFWGDVPSFTMRTLLLLVSFAAVAGLFHLMARYLPFGGES